MGALITSIVAVIVAIVIPIIIAYKQNKIALFDKRFKSFDVLQRYIALADLLKDNQGNDNYNSAVIVVFFNGDSEDIKRNNVLIKLIEISTPLKFMPFLFKNITEKEVDYMIRSLCAFVRADLREDDVEKYKQLYINTVQNFCDNHLINVKKSLKNQN